MPRRVQILEGANEVTPSQNPSSGEHLSSYNRLRFLFSKEVSKQNSYV